MVLSSKLEVCQCDSNESSNYQEDYKDNKQDVVYSIDPVTPDTGKYIVNFDVYSTERQKACHCHLWNRSQYHGKGGISLGYLVVWQGAWNSALLFFPAMPPNTSKGDVTSVHIRTITTIVQNGRATVAL